MYSMYCVDLYLSCCCVLTDAIDKGDSRRLGKKPVFSSSQVNLIATVNNIPKKHNLFYFFLFMLIF